MMKVVDSGMRQGWMHFSWEAWHKDDARRLPRSMETSNQYNLQFILDTWGTAYSTRNSLLAMIIQFQFIKLVLALGDLSCSLL